MTMISDSSRSQALQIVEALRKGIPPVRGVEEYSVGHERLLAGIRSFHLSTLSEQGLIRFVSGSWGSGKTHFFRVLRDAAFAEQCLVSNVELDVGSAALNRFEKVFGAIVSHVASAEFFEGDDQTDCMPFGRVLEHALRRLGGQASDGTADPANEAYVRASERLMVANAIDIDFRKMVQHYCARSSPTRQTPEASPKSGAKSCNGSLATAHQGTFARNST